MEDDSDAEDKTPHGHITSLSVMRTYRRMGIAEKLMRQSLYAILTSQLEAQYVSLHVQSNRGLCIAINSLSLRTPQFEKVIIKMEKMHMPCTQGLRLEELCLCLFPENKSSGRLDVDLLS